MKNLNQYLDQQYSYPSGTHRFSFATGSWYGNNVYVNDYHKIYCDVEVLTCESCGNQIRIEYAKLPAVYVLICPTCGGKIK